MTKELVTLTVVVNADTSTDEEHSFEVAKQVSERLTDIVYGVHPAPTAFFKDYPLGDELDYTLHPTEDDPFPTLWVRVGAIALQISPWGDGAKVNATPADDAMATLASAYFPPPWEHKEN